MRVSRTGVDGGRMAKWAVPWPATRGGVERNGLCIFGSAPWSAALGAGKGLIFRQECAGKECVYSSIELLIGFGGVETWRVPRVGDVGMVGRVSESCMAMGD